MKDKKPKCTSIVERCLFELDNNPQMQDEVSLVAETLPHELKSNIPLEELDEAILIAVATGYVLAIHHVSKTPDHWSRVADCRLYDEFRNTLQKQMGME